MVTELVRPSSNCKSTLEIRPLVREGAAQEGICKCLAIPRQTGRLTIGPKIASTSTSDRGSVRSGPEAVLWFRGDSR
jgi:hypothetical protein